MKKFALVSVLFLTLFFNHSKSVEVVEATLSKGLSVVGSDSSFSLKFGLIIQPRLTFNGDLPVCGSCGKNDYLDFETRRLRLRFDGFIGIPNLTYSVQLGVSSRDLESIKGSNDELTGIVYDAFIDWEFIKKTKLRVGQAKLPGSLSRLMSFNGLNFLERSNAESRFNTYRDIGLQLIDETKLFGDLTIREMFAVSHGEGVNMKTDANGGLAYSGRLEFYPFGLFEKAGETYEMDIQFEKTPKLLFGGAYYLNAGAIRERGVLGKELLKINDKIQIRDINQIFADILFKWKGFAFMGEFYIRDAENPITLDTAKKYRYVYIGQGYGGQISYMFAKDICVALRYSKVIPHQDLYESTQIKVKDLPTKRADYSLGLTYFLFANKLKIQLDGSYFTEEKFKIEQTKYFEIRTNLLYSF